MSAWERWSVGAVKATICKDSLQWEISSQWKWPQNQHLDCCLATFPGIISYKSFGSCYVPNSKSILFDWNLLEWFGGQCCWQQHPQSFPLLSWAVQECVGRSSSAWGWHWLTGTSTGQEWCAFCWRIHGFNQGLLFNNRVHFIRSLITRDSVKNLAREPQW